VRYLLRGRVHGLNYYLVACAPLRLFLIPFQCYCPALILPPPWPFPPYATTTQLPACAFPCVGPCPLPPTPIPTPTFCLVVLTFSFGLRVLHLRWRNMPHPSSVDAMETGCAVAVCVCVAFPFHHSHSFFLIQPFFQFLFCGLYVPFALYATFHRAFISSTACRALRVNIGFPFAAIIPSGRVTYHLDVAHVPHRVVRVSHGYRSGLSFPKRVCYRTFAIYHIPPPVWLTFCCGGVALSHVWLLPPGYSPVTPRIRVCGPLDFISSSGLLFWLYVTVIYSTDSWFTCVIYWHLPLQALRPFPD